MWRILLAGVATIGVAGCLQGANPPEHEAYRAASIPAAARVALVLGDGMAPYLDDIEKGAQAAARENHVEVLRVNGRADPSGEVERLRRSGAGAIVFVSASSAGHESLFDMARRAGIPLVAVGAVPDPAAALPYVAVDDEQSAYLAVTALLAGDVDGLQVAVLESGSESIQTRARRAGIDRALAEHGEVQVLARQRANGRIDQAYETTRQLFAAHPQIDLVIGSSDAMALGALKYLRDSRRPQVRVAGFGALPEARAALTGGGFALTVDPRIEKQAYLGVEYAARSLRGGDVPPVTLLEADLLLSPRPRP